MSDRDDYHPARNVSPEAVDRAMATLDSEELETMNRASSADSALGDGRVLVEVSQQSAEYVRRHAQALDRDPGVVLDEMIRYAQVHHEEALDDYRGSGPEASR